MWHIIIIALALGGLAGIAFVKYQQLKRLVRPSAVIIETPQSSPSQPEEKQNAKKNKRINFRELKRAFNTADLLFTKGNLEEAAKAFLNVLAIYSDHEEATNKLGLVYLQQNLPSKAELLFTKLTEFYPKNAVYFSNLALALYKQEKLEESITAYVKAISFDRKRPARYLSLAEVYKKKGETDRVLGCYLEASTLEPRNIDLLFAVADLYNERGDTEKSQEFLNKILTYQPYNKEAKERIVTRN